MGGPEIIAAAVDEIAVLVHREIAAPRIIGHGLEHRIVIDGGHALRNDEETLTIDRHVGGDLRGIDRALHRIGIARLGDHGAGLMEIRRRGGHDVVEARIGPLEAGCLAVCDIV